MDSLVWKRNAINTLTNYANQFLKIVNSFVITRVLFECFGGEGYGIWTFLWVFFGYTIILDFGLGSSAKKFAAEYLANKDLEKLNKGISTVFLSYCSIGLLIAFLTYLAVNLFYVHFETPNAPNIFEVKKLFQIFGYSMAVIFPFGIFSEVQTGLHRIDMRNFISLGVNVLNLVGVTVLSYLGKDLIFVMSFSLATHLLGPLANLFSCFLLVRGFRIKANLFDKTILKEIFRFSFNSYLSNFIIIIVQKFDQLIIGFFLGFSSVGFYQVATRLGNLLKILSEQYQDNVAPLTARKTAEGEEAVLGKWIFEVNKLSRFFTVGILIFLFIYADVFLKVWLKIDDPETILIAHIGLLYTAINSIQRSVSCNFLLMSGEDKFLAKASMLEVSLNIVISLALVKVLGVIGVLLGTIVPGVFIGQYIYFKASSRTGFGRSKYNNSTLLSLCGLAIMLLLFRIELYDFMSAGIIELGLFFALHIGLVILSIYLFILKSRDRQKVNGFINSMIPFSMEQK